VECHQWSAGVPIAAITPTSTFGAQVGVTQDHYASILATTQARLHVRYPQFHLDGTAFAGKGSTPSCHGKRLAGILAAHIIMMSLQGMEMLGGGWWWVVFWSSLEINFISLMSCNTKIVYASVPFKWDCPIRNKCSIPKFDGRGWKSQLVEVGQSVNHRGPNLY